MNADVASFLLRCTIPTGQQGQQVQQAPQRRVGMPNKISLSKEGVQNIQEQAMSASRQSGTLAGAQAGGRQMPAPPKKVDPIRTEKKVLPNEPCPCGSGKKFKKCHG
jgi:preprotein translocase subunit SecA